MTQAKPAAVRQTSAQQMPRSLNVLAAVLLGVPLAAAILAIVHAGPLRGTLAERYLSHPVEAVEVLLFCLALGALVTKLGGYLAERAACRAVVLPAWDGQAHPVSAAGELLAGLHRLSRRLHNTYLVRRVSGVLDFVCGRGSANDLDDHMRTLADNDALALEGSYSLIRFITWAIPILGFLGTVLGIAEAVTGVTPEMLEESLSTVTDGLALAFDTTALALGLTMIVMFLSFLVERLEQNVLEAVDRVINEQLAHRFERTGPEGGEFVEVVRQNTHVLLQAAEQLVERQAAVWTRTIEAAEQRWVEAEQRQHERLTAALEAALERTLDSHARRLTEMEQQFQARGATLLEGLSALAGAIREAGREQREALAQALQRMADQAEALARLQEGEKHLIRLQEALHENLTALAGAGAFEQAVHSLTAAIHLLTARTSGGNRLGVRPPNAA